jgi:hypothetical protein
MTNPLLQLQTRPEPAAAGKFRRLLNGLLGSTLAGALALGAFAGTAAPAKADGDDLVKGVIALGALGIVANSLSDHDHSPRRAQPLPPPPPPPPGHFRPRPGPPLPPGPPMPAGPAHFERDVRRDAPRHDRFREGRGGEYRGGYDRGGYDRGGYDRGYANGGDNVPFPYRSR